MSNYVKCKVKVKGGETIPGYVYCTYKPSIGETLWIDLGTGNIKGYKVIDIEHTVMYGKNNLPLVIIVKEAIYP